MVTTSFTLRKTATGFGSYTRKNADDTALRSDGFVTATAALSGNNTFSANIINSGSILLSWSLSFALATSGETPAPTQLTIVASTTGEPQTVKDGTLVTSISSNSVSSYTDSVRTEEGRWVYYSLFAKYSDFEATPTEWYEKLTSLYIQVPKTYNSLNNLWARIPEYYRNLDAQQEDQPLYNFLELFGWELDRTRTLIDTVALSNDPDIAVTPALAELAYEMGLETTIDAVGPTKVRRLLSSIGQVRRQKGTVNSVEYYLNALTGCTVSYTTTGVGASASHIFNVHSQRINFCADPTFNQAVTGSATSTFGSTRSSYTKSSTWGVFSYGESSTTGASVTTNGSQLTVSNVGTGTITAYVYQRTSFPYYHAANLYTNFTPTLSAGASFGNFQIALPLVMDIWESGVTFPSLPTFYDTWNTSRKEIPSNSFYPSQKRYEITTNSASATTINVIPVLTFSLNAGASVVIKNWMVEPYSVGDYFDGDTKEGGYIPSLSGSGLGTYDYRWAGTARSSFSYYMLDYKRTTDTTDDIIKNYIVPVTVKDNVQINWNYYYGKT